MAYFNRTHLAGSYVSKEQPHSKPRKPGRVKIVSDARSNIIWFKGKRYSDGKKRY
jgi:hypothetical protein